MIRPALVIVLLGAACSGVAPPDEPAADDTGGLSQDDGGTTNASATAADDGPRLDLGGAGDALVGGGDCDGLGATIRDFLEAHPDFEDYKGNNPSLELVLPELGADMTPQVNPDYGGKEMYSSAESFAQWYHDVPDVNLPFEIELPLVEDPPGVFVFDSSAFFPIDDQGFGNEDNDHNFHFTTELHTSFTYAGGEVFTFRGDDDLWIFVDGTLALDLGGLHPPEEGTIEMDTLGLEPGESYPMDIFHAERRTQGSNFRIETTIACFVTPPPPG